MGPLIVELIHLIITFVIFSEALHLLYYEVKLLRLENCGVANLMFFFCPA